MGLIRLFLYDRPPSMIRFAVELTALMLLLALVVGFVAAKTLILLQQ